jgi:7-cyano-7-deazaguanine synthase
MSDDISSGVERGVALVSGGLDSVVSLAMADREIDIRLVLFCNYGQRSASRERAAVIDVAGYYGLPFREVDVTWLRELSPRGMRGRAGADADQGAPGADGELETLDAVWIPNRNGVLVNVAAAFAERYGCGVVVTGFNREEAVEFPDNSPEFVDAANRSLAYSTRSGVRVVSFTQGLTKRGIIEKGVELSVPLGGIWSCYRGGDVMCGKCASCRRLKMALDSVAADRRPLIEFAG